MGSMLIGAGTLLLLLYLVPTVTGTVLSRLAISQFRAQSASNSLWDSARIRAYQHTLGLSFHPAEAILRVHRLGLEVPILDGDDDITLNRGAGHIPGTARLGESGNIGVTGHRDGFFRPLKDIVPGDTIEIVRHGQTDRYLVRQIKIVFPSDTSVLNKTTDSTLTLVTCYPFYFVGAAPQRYIVQASLLPTPPTP
ncbi:class D sortase [Granulicella sp. dw_53]|uniref:class D sortase n=1 Tax=Granulicella sp. dw_53 TaxID=2719792 RepID=UPI001BD5035F|nr:class D sortase [Granulicella sp. dw_53]